MKLHVANHSTVVPHASAQTMTAAVAAQLQHDVAPAWDRTRPTFTLSSGTPQLVILDDADQAGALGYHDVDPNGQPYGRVFAKTVLDNGGTLLDGPDSVSACLSHEAIELFLDAACSEWGDRGDGVEIAWEGCDPVQGDSYVIAGVAVSDFILPAYFDPAAPGPYDHMGVLTAPFSVAKHGYLIVRKAGVEGQKFGEFEFGDPAPPGWQAPVKLHPAARTARRLA